MEHFLAGRFFNPGLFMYETFADVDEGRHLTI